LGFLPHKPTSSALARIQDVDQSIWTADSSVSGGGGRSMEAKVRLCVMPEGQPEFDSEARVWGMDAVEQLAAGRETYVLYDPKHASRCEIDRQRLRVEFGPGRNGKDRVVILTTAEARFEDTLASRAKDPAASAQHRQEILERAAAAQADSRAIVDALQTGDFAEVERLKAQLAIGGTGVAAAADPLDRLQKLADLHDRGALTDAEFAAEKAKILGAG
jgi:hypothetical protein